MANFATWSFGPYTATVALHADLLQTPTDVGLFEGSQQFIGIPNGQAITPDRFGGGTIVDGIYQGANVLVQLGLKEWTSAVKYAMWPFSPTDLGLTGVIGRAWTDMARKWVFTAIAGTPAATQGPATRTFIALMPTPQSQILMEFGNVERNIGLVFQSLPQLVSAGTSQLRHFTDT